LNARVATAFFGAAPEILLFSGDCQTKPTFFEPLRDPKGSMHIVSPSADPRSGAARSFAERYEARYGIPPEPQAYFAYEAMAVILDSIRRAGDRGDDRAAVRDAFFATRDRSGLVGEYSIDAAGDTTLRTVGLFAVRDRKLAFEELITVP
jgi:branched-chain amino acid transport system substrate-binding protein